MSARQIGDTTFTMVTVRFTTVERLRAEANGRSYDELLLDLLRRPPASEERFCRSPDPKDPARRCRLPAGHPGTVCRWWDRYSRRREWAKPGAFHVE